MKKRLSRKQMFFNKINLTKDDEVYVGIDVHKKSHSVAIWLNDAPAIDFVMPAENEKLVKLLEKLRIALKMVVYEAGPAGYSLARQLQKASLPVRVVAPSKTLRHSARDSKTDRQLKETFSQERYVPKMKVLLTHPGLYKPKSTNSSRHLSLRGRNGNAYILRSNRLKLKSCVCPIIWPSYPLQFGPIRIQ